MGRAGQKSCPELSRTATNHFHHQPHKKRVKRLHLGSSSSPCTLRKMTSSKYFLVKCLLLLACLPSCTAWTTKSDGPRRRSSTSQRPPITTYAPPTTTPAESQSTTAQKMLKIPGNPRTSNSPRKSSLKLSQSVLASCDTLPSFRTAHGILSPETVLRMEELVDKEDRSEALNQFLERYRRKGPMSCLPMLSDPDVLPHLTNAMRDVLE